MMQNLASLLKLTRITVTEQKRAMWLGSVLLGSLVPGPATANDVPPLPLETQFLRADLVAVGRLGTPTTCIMAGRRYPCAELGAEVVLKGERDVMAHRYLLLHFGIMEHSIEDVQIPDSALFFLVRMRTSNSDGASENRELYRAIQGPRSIFPLQNDNE